MQYNGHMAEYEPETQDVNQSAPEKPSEQQVNGEDAKLSDGDQSADAVVQPPVVDSTTEQKPPKSPGKTEGKLQSLTQFGCVLLLNNRFNTHLLS